jgi:hypothetical protein
MSRRSVPAWMLSHSELRVTGPTLAWRLEFGPTVALTDIARRTFLREHDFGTPVVGKKRDLPQYLQQGPANRRDCPHGRS